ncbi:5'-AMP-activated protein kinase subunit beta-2-like isoform X6 [Cyclopterus lumpus]|uniref:5'-AMP-activated protein kinase subunit beta-2-like isoform X6 n=1 Tax=Cyclopterus lumpus TaxID=8103 RepID=UPI0014868E99|nr:5'-AMP-activated protein kinase subunit beta-2-like isoform X6 [Cyclopterus lumpus]
MFVIQCVSRSTVNSQASWATLVTECLEIGMEPRPTAQTAAAAATKTKNPAARWLTAQTTPTSSTPMGQSRSHNDFVAILDLPEGEHQYKFFVDGQWVHDSSETVVTSQLGTINNLIQVKKSDFEVFDALHVDSLESSDTSDLSSSPPGPYGQEQYSFRPDEHFKAPPILPPHLLQVILNKDTNISCDPALLPEPNHVMLNHLYALSIKDGVMVLSATHRYKKKYVTSLLYKPI